MGPRRNWFAASILAASVSVTHAHHSASAYDESRTMTVSGVVSRLQWRNPHVIVRLEVTDETGKKTQWPLESAGIPRLVADGWNRDLVGQGARISAEIHPTRRGKPGGIIRWVTLEDGRVLPIDPESPTGSEISQVKDISAEQSAQDRLRAAAAKSAADYLARRPAVERQEASNRPSALPKVAEGGMKGALDPANRQALKGVARYDFTGVWQHRSFREVAEQRGGKPWEFLPVPELTDKARAVQAEILQRRADGDATADPATLCYPHGLMRSMTRNGNMMLLQVETAVFMVHRMNNDFRAVYWDGRDHVDPAIRVQSYNGDAIGFWADDHLFVETVGFGSPLMYINPGIPIGSQGRVEERWRLINDGNTLEIEFRMTDPEHWVGEWIDTKYWDRIHGTDIREGNCIVAEDAELAIGGNR